MKSIIRHTLFILAILLTFNACTIQITIGHPNEEPTTTTTVAPTTETTAATTAKTTTKKTTAKKTTAKKTTTKKTTKKTTAKKNINNLYGDLKAWLKANGRAEGAVIGISKDPSVYGIDSWRTFEVSYCDENEIVQFAFSDYTGTVCYDIFCLEIPRTFSGSYHFDVALYNFNTGYNESYHDGEIFASDFTRHSEESFGHTNSLIVSQLLDCIAGFLKGENLGYTLQDMGFVNYK